MFLLWVNVVHFRLFIANSSPGRIPIKIILEVKWPTGDNGTTPVCPRIFTGIALSLFEKFGGECSKFFLMSRVMNICIFCSSLVDI
jgi:hypothetical protein